MKRKRKVTGEEKEDQEQCLPLLHVTVSLVVLLSEGC